MKIREFNKNLKLITTKNKLDLNKIQNLSDETRTNMIYFIVRNRQPVLFELIPENFDISWLHTMGYLEKTTGKSGYTFIHTCKHRIK